MSSPEDHCAADDPQGERRSPLALFVRHSAIVGAGLQATNLFNFLFHILLVRLLTAADYGAVAAVMALVLLLTQAVQPLEAALTRHVAMRRSQGDTEGLPSEYWYVSRDLAILTVALSAGLVLFAQPVARLQKLDHAGWVVLAAFAVLSTLSCVPPRALLQGAQRFARYAFLEASAAAAKLVIGVGLVVAGWGVWGALTGVAIGPLFVVGGGLLSAVAMFGNPRGRRPAPRAIRSIYRYCLPAAALYSSLTVAAHLDVTLVKAFFSPDEAGTYNVARVVGLLLFYLPGAITVVVFPKVAHDAARGAGGAEWLHRGLVTAAGICGLAIIVCVAWPQWVLMLVSGKTDPVATSLVGWFALMMGLHGLVWLVSYYNLAKGHLLYIWVFPIFPIVQVTLLCLFHSSLGGVVTLLACCAAGTFAGSLLLTKLATRRAARPLSGGVQ